LTQMISNNHSMKQILVFLGLVIVVVVNAQKTERSVYINPGFGLYRLTTDPNNINNKPFMIEGKVGTDVGKNAVIGLQFSNALQNIPTSGLYTDEPVGGIFTNKKRGNLKHQLTALGLFYERFFPVGKRIDFFPSVYIQYLKLTEEERGNILTPTDSSTTYRKNIKNNYSGRFGLNLNVQYKITKPLSITLRFAQIDCRLWDKNRKNILGELPLIVGIKYSY
jgi:hypothetical protein